MDNKQRNIDILEHIMDYCVQIDETISRLGEAYCQFENDKIYQNAVSLCVLQIGELSGLLNEEFRNKFDAVPWRNIRGMRNLVAHRYGTMKVKILWDTITNDIPVLKKYCIYILDQFTVLGQDALPEIEDDE